MTHSDMTPQTSFLKPEADYLAPDSSEIRLLPTVKGGGLCHCTLPAGKTSYPVFHLTVEEIWYVIEGQGEIWRKAGNFEDIVSMHVGTSLTIPVRTSFQFRNSGSGPLCILIVTSPPWPGEQEAVHTVGKWPSGIAKV